jgi:hypothetical protein
VKRQLSTHPYDAKYRDRGLRFFFQVAIGYATRQPLAELRTVRGARRVAKAQGISHVRMNGADLTRAIFQRRCSVDDCKIYLIKTNTYDAPKSAFYILWIIDNVQTKRADFWTQHGIQLSRK